jgi:exonuclease VII small subunit
MKKTIDEKLSDALDIEAEIIPLDQELILNDVKDVNKTDIKNDDYEYARQNLKNIISTGQDAIDGIMILAKEGESPRAYEVVGQLMKNMVDANKDLLELQKKVNEIENGKSSLGRTTQNITNNALFVGTSKDLQSLIKDMKDKETDE